MSDLTTEERLSKIRAAVRQLDKDKDTDWTKTGLPDGDRVKDLTGFRSVTRGEIEEAMPGFTRDTPPDDPGNKQIEEAATISGGTGDLYTEGRTPADLAAMLPDPIFLIEAAVAAAANPRYTRNAELTAFLRHYQVSQTNIKAHQKRIDARNTEREKAAAEAARNAE